VVCKLGGSLLNWPGLPGALERMRRLRPAGALLVVVGGGETADLVRRWDQLFQLGEERSHWLALDSLALNEQLLQVLWPELRPVRSRSQFESAERAGIPALLCASCFVRWGEKAGGPLLPHCWRVTTDSIAAWTAQMVEADELLLLKSIDLPPGITLVQAAAQGCVDEYFPTAARDLVKITWVNLRNEDSAEQVWIDSAIPEEQPVSKPGE